MRARWGVAGLVVVLAVLGVACGGGDDGADGADVRPFSEVQGSALTFELDPSDPTRGIFRVTTTEPMICAIVWGETEAYGNLNNSLAMSGTGLIEHAVVLPDVVPGRTYHFQVQGSTADGTLYRSDPATFTLEPTAPPVGSADPATRGPNLAVGATVVAVSSEFGDAFAAANAVDGVGTTEWSSAGDGDDASITVDLGAPRVVAGVEFVTRSMADGSAVAETFTVTVDDGEVFGPFPAGTPAAPAVAEVSTTGQRFRFDVERSSGGNVGAVEVGVYGP